MQKTPLLKGTFYLGISQAVFILSGYITNIFLARYLGPESYGIYGIVISFITILKIILANGFAQAISKYCSEDESLAYSIKISMLKILIPFSIFIAIICYFSAPLISVILKDKSLIPFIHISIPIIPLFTIYAIFDGYFNGLYLFNKQSYLLIIYSSLKLFFIISLSIYFGLYGTFTGFIVALIFTLLLVVLFSEKGKYSYFNILKLIKFAFPIIINSMTFSILMNLDLLMIKSILLNDKLTGYYNASFTLSRIPVLFLSGVLGTIIFPVISSSIKKQPIEKTRNLISRWIKFSLISVLPITFLFSFNGPELINLLYSELYSQSSKSFLILIYGMMFFTIFIILASILKGAGKPYIPLIITLISLILNFLLNIYLIPNFQLNGAAISTSVVGLLMVVLTSYIIYKEFRVFISIKSFIKIVFASLITSLPVKFIVIPKILIPIEYIFSIAFYFIILYYLKEIKREDVDKIKKALSTFIL